MGCMIATSVDDTNQWISRKNTWQILGADNSKYSLLPSSFAEWLDAEKVSKSGRQHENGG
jgi:hypothetical protein